ncbi:hypothetical protein [Hymenobacter norwichensis]|uniref:hypothetical protein n=1 Tax=Hymenobacter norwichensis TaxID=223903 RepID=UPI0003B3DE0F|nr:hypothetical protein [Hymenobacter norwichensis]
MKNYLLLCSLLATLGSSSCKKKIDFGPDEGVTYRDFLNYPQSQNDPSDWTLDGNWNKEEKKLFNSLGFDVNSTASGSFRNISFFPNPVETEGVLTCQTTASGLSVKLVLVDRKYRVLDTVTDSSTTTSSYSYRFTFDNSKYKTDEIYRLYYVFYQGSTLYYKGHGDIKIAK